MKLRTSRIALFLALFLASGAFLSCSHEDSVKADGLLTFRADYGRETATRTWVNESGIMRWSTTDRINVNGEASVTTSLDGEGMYASFGMDVDINTMEVPYYAMYPASMVKSYADGVFRMDVPAVQPYRDGISFADGVNPAVAVSTDRNLSFYNICGIMRVVLEGNNAQVKTIRLVTAGETVSGAASIRPEMPPTATPGLFVMDEAPGTGHDCMDITVADGQTFGEADNNIQWVLPVGKYAARWKIELLDADGKLITTTPYIDKAFEIKRSRRSFLGKIVIDPEAEFVKFFLSVNEWQEGDTVVTTPVEWE